MDEMEMAKSIVQILHLLCCVRKKNYGLGIEMKKGILVRGSIEER